MALSGTDLINRFELYFDGADMTNASLYLCVDDSLDDAGAQRDLSRVQECGRDRAASEEALELGGERRRDVSTHCVWIEEDARVAPHEGVQVSGVAPG